MTSAAIPASTIPARMSSQKWLPVAITANQTHAGQASHSAFDHQCRQTNAIVIPTMSASAECSDGIAAYGFDASETKLEPWFRPPNSASVSGKPNVGNIRGGAVGSST